MAGAAPATIIGLGVTFVIALAPFGLALTPNISLVIINRFGASYGGEKAIAAYVCISYVICIIYMILQGYPKILLVPLYNSPANNLMNNCPSLR